MTNVEFNSCFFKMSEPEREKIDAWFDHASPTTVNQLRFFCRVRSALKRIKYDYYIATMEPSFDKKGNIFYKKNCEVSRGITRLEWAKRARMFYSDGRWHSELALLEEGDLFKAYRIACGYWTKEYVCDDSSENSNYWDAETSTHYFELSGEREIGGFCDGIGNTVELYRYNDGFVDVGGCYIYQGSNFPISSERHFLDPQNVDYYEHGVLVIKMN